MQPHQDMLKRRTELLPAFIAEYNALRAQIIEQVKAVYIIFTTTATVFAASITAGTLAWERAIVSTTIFNVVIPLFLLTAAIGLAFGAKDMAALGNYIRVSIEERLEVLWGADLKKMLDSAGQPTGVQRVHLLGWEHAIRKQPGGKHLLIDGNLGIFTAVFTILFGATSTLGLLRVLTEAGWGLYPTKVRYTLALFPFVILLILIVTALLLYKRTRGMNVEIVSTKPTTHDALLTTSILRPRKRK